nr:hypothetical protein [Streptomyces sp. CC228A]
MADLVRPGGVEQTVGRLPDGRRLDAAVQRHGAEPVEVGPLVRVRHLLGQQGRGEEGREYGGPPPGVAALAEEEAQPAGPPGARPVVGAVAQAGPQRVRQPAVEERPVAGGGGADVVREVEPDDRAVAVDVVADGREVAGAGEFDEAVRRDAREVGGLGGADRLYAFMQSVREVRLGAQPLHLRAGDPPALAGSGGQGPHQPEVDGQRELVPPQRQFLGGARRRQGVHGVCDRHSGPPPSSPLLSVTKVARSHVCRCACG